ncbi:MAG: response regulator transcription factor [Bacillus sp. (in: Bacteria)]|nr:response regulator transcription factor [Bacillus sp. (in: firmicutes)]MCM1427619.1 response regulator transcription factor [Eubacterium sp.]
MGREILLVEDDESLNRAVSLKLEKEGYLVYPAATMKAAEDMHCLHEVSLIICDIDLPDGNGLDFCVRVRKDSDVMFLFLTASDTETDMLKGYRAGADDYITKPFYLTALVSKVNALMKRHLQEKEPDMLISGSITLYTAQNRTQKDGVYLKLTAKEQSLLTFFMQNPMRILSKNQLLEAIWDIDGSFVDDNTLAVNIRRLREKIEDDSSNPMYLKNVRGLGYIWEKSVKAKTS